MKIHRNLIWVKADPALIDELMADRKMGAMVAVRLEPGLCGVLSKNGDSLLKRLHELKHAPREI